jgi:hypothetical protein
MWKDYAVPGGTFRENLLHKPGQKVQPDDSFAAKWRYENLKKQGGMLDENGDIVVDRRETAPEKKEEVKPAVVEPVKEMEKLKVNGDSAVAAA